MGNGVNRMARGSRAGYTRADMDDVFGARALELLLGLLAQDENHVSGKVLRLRAAEYTRRNCQHHPPVRV